MNVKFSINWEDIGISGAARKNSDVFSKASLLQHYDYFAIIACCAIFQSDFM